MRFTSAAFLAFAASAFAQTSGFDALTTPTQDESIPAGQAYTINWQPGTYTTGTVTLSLLGGATPSTLLDLGSFASGIQNSVGTYTWTVDSSLGDAATYGIKITLDSDNTIFQYSFPFHISASAAATTSSSSSAVVVTTATGYPTSAPAVVSSTVVTYSAVEITSSSAAPTTVVASTSAAATVSSVVSYSVISSASTFATAAPSGNGTYTASTSHGATTLTSATTKGSSSTSSSATATASVVTTNSAGRAAAGSFALVAAVAAVFLI